jgi:hypothetical protein
MEQHLFEAEVAFVDEAALVSRLETTTGVGSATGSAMRRANCGEVLMN